MPYIILDPTSSVRTLPNRQTDGQYQIVWSADNPQEARDLADRPERLRVTGTGEWW